MRADAIVAEEKGPSGDGMRMTVAANGPARGTISPSRVYRAPNVIAALREGDENQALPLVIAYSAMRSSAATGPLFADAAANVVRRAVLAVGSRDNAVRYSSLTKESTRSLSSPRNAPMRVSESAFIRGVSWDVPSPSGGLMESPFEHAR